MRVIGKGEQIAGRLQSLHHSSKHNSSLRDASPGRRVPDNLLFSNGLGVPHIITAPFPTSGIHPVFRPLILCSARILRSYRTESESRPIGLIHLISVD